MERRTDVLEQWLADIESRMGCGETFDQIEEEINADTSIDDEQKAALWLFAWSCQSRAQQRRTARGHVLNEGVLDPGLGVD